MGRATATPNDEWQNVVHRLCAKLKLGAALGQGFEFNPKGAAAMAELLAEMAIRLDEAVALGLATKPKVKVTSEGNNA